MKIIKNMFVDVSDVLSVEVFLTLCEEQGINWRSGSKPRAYKTKLDYIIVDDFERKLELCSLNYMGTYSPNDLIRFSVTD
jgi:hypothetical protein